MKIYIALFALGFILGTLAGGYGGNLYGIEQTWGTAVVLKAAHYDPQTGERKWGASPFADVSKKMPQGAGIQLDGK